MKLVTAAPFVVVAALLAGAGLLSLVRREGPPAPAQAGEAPLFKTPSWAKYDSEEIDRELKAHPDKKYQPTPRPEGAMMLRCETPGGGALLLRHTARETLYRYDPAGRTLAKAGVEEWERATGPVAECDKQFAPPQSVLVIDQKADALRAADGRLIHTAGRVPLYLTASPGGKLVAVLSADGPKKGSPMPFSGDRVLGRRHHQVHSLPGATAEGAAVLLPDFGEPNVPSACWSADEQFIVYHDYGFYALSVIETRLPSTPKP